MVDRLSSLDVSFLYLEGPTTPMHVGELLTFTPAESERLDYDRLLQLIESRIALVPRYRQKIRTVPGNLAAPVWVDDPDFDITFHVRRSGLPRPGSDEQLREFTARIMSRPLDRSRPLWEMYLVEGLDAGMNPGRVAIITKTHHALVDGISAIDIGTVILDAAPDAHDPPTDLWVPEPEPGDAALVAQAVAELVRRPARTVDVVRAEVADVRSSVGRVAGAVGGLLSAARTAARPAPHSPLNVDIGAQRRYGVARTSLEDYRAVRAERGGTVNDVVLATVAAALRSWLLFRGEAVHPGTTVRAMVPVSVRDEDSRTPATGKGSSRVSSYAVDLPVGEPNPLVRLSQVTYAMRAHAESGQSVGADAIVALGGFAPPTLHAVGARAAYGLTRRAFNLVVTNVPGPQFPLYAAGARLDELFPIVPLARGQAVSIGLTSYDGGVYYGLNADRDAMPDVDVLGSLIEESLAELVVAAREAAPHRPADRPVGAAPRPGGAGPGVGGSSTGGSRASGSRASGSRSGRSSNGGSSSGGSSTGGSSRGGSSTGGSRSGGPSTGGSRSRGGAGSQTSDDAMRRAASGGASPGGTTERTGSQRTGSQRTGSQRTGKARDTAVGGDRPDTEARPSPVSGTRTRRTSSDPASAPRSTSGRTSGAGGPSTGARTAKATPGRPRSAAGREDGLATVVDADARRVARARRAAAARHARDASDRTDP